MFHNEGLNTCNYSSKNEQFVGKLPYLNSHIHYPTTLLLSRAETSQATSNRHNIMPGLMPPKQAQSKLRKMEL